MFSSRYGDIREIAAHTDGDCHLCLQPADLALYGPTGSFGADTVTVDHVVPQSHGGGDELENLRLAHGGCNSTRGTRDVEVARYELAGTINGPMGSGEKTAWSLGGGAVAAFGAGHVFAREMPDGTRQFNREAALIAGLLTSIALRVWL
jgi:hypothetical protein